MVVNSAAFAKLMQADNEQAIRTAQFMLEWAQLTEEMRERVRVMVHGMSLYQQAACLTNTNYTV